jgi:Holliday junction resolvase
MNSRAKGQRAERALAKLLTDVLGDKVVRNTDPLQVSGGDILSVEGFSIEVKHCQVLRLKVWWEQACRQAAKVQREPMLFFKQNRQPWRVMLVGAQGPREATWDEAMDHIVDKAMRLHAIYPEAA